MYEAVEVFVNIFQAFAITYYLIKCLGVKEGKNRKCAYITGVIVTVLYLEIMNRIIFFESVGVLIYLVVSLAFSAVFLCGNVAQKIMYRIAIPLCVPTIATLCLFYAVGRWNGIDDQLYYVQKTGLHTVQMALKQMIEAVNVQSEESGTTQLVAENIKAASITLSMTPMLVVYPFIQRFFTQGIMLGAVKG